MTVTFPMLMTAFGALAGAIVGLLVLIGVLWSKVSVIEGQLK